METITLEVKNEIAQKWNKVPIQSRRRINKDLEQRLEAHLRNEKMKEMKKLISEVSAEAKKNGLTQEILD
jgi:Tfp pilus assembly protein PilO